MSKDYKKDYYEQKEHWDENLFQDSAQEERINAVIDLIPGGVESILDVGCGNGVFVNSILDKYKVVGLEISQGALKYVESDKVMGNINALPFKSDSFDLVTCLEIIEHLSSIDLDKGIQEIERVSKKYIIVTVPNKEILEYAFMTCPDCHRKFHPSLHEQAFDEEKIKGLFSSFELVKIRKIGPFTLKIPYNKKIHLALGFYNKFLPSFNLSRLSICPYCGYQPKKCEHAKMMLSHRIFLTLKFFMKFLFPFWFDRIWLLCLYRKNSKNYF